MIGKTGPAPQPPIRMDLARVLQALSDPIRLELVSILARRGEVPCGAFGLSIPKSSLSHHFKTLRESGIVASHREGKELLNILRMEELERAFPGLLPSVLGAMRSQGQAPGQD